MVTVSSAAVNAVTAAPKPVSPDMSSLPTYWDPGMHTGAGAQLATVSPLVLHLTVVSQLP